MQKDVTAITAHLADYERVRRIALLPEEFSIEKGEMTPTLKVKRAVIEEKYGRADRRALSRRVVVSEPGAVATGS